MTNEELQQHIAAILNARDAGLIEEVRGDCTKVMPAGGRGLDSKLLLGDDSISYRIKPQPREVFVANFDLCKGATSFTATHLPIEGHHCTKFREVIE